LNHHENPVLPVRPVLPELPKTVSSAAPTAPREPATSVLNFPVVGQGGPLWSLTADQVAEWRELFPGLDILAEARKALAWVKANDGRRKTASGMKRFLVGWFTRTVNNGGSRAPVEARRATAEVIRSGGWDCPHTPACPTRNWCESGARDLRDAQRRKQAASP
jgi:hypothetical protein